ncbi:hypothetical protein HOY82DRAFT_615461 [Tuber indicum]|nr:hypothetical protein HOY82DRAFT_615461 [Tuber indicum]
MDREFSSFPPSTLPTLQRAANIPPSPEIESRCHYLTSKIFSLTNSVALSELVHELATITLRLSSQLAASSNALHMESVRSAHWQSINHELRSNLVETKEALATTENMLTRQTTKTELAHASLQKKSAEIRLKNLKIEKMKKSTKYFIKAKFGRNRKTAQKVVSCTSGETDSEGTLIGVFTDSDNGVGNQIKWESGGDVGSGSAHGAIPGGELLEKTQLLNAEKQRTHGPRKLHHSALKEVGCLKTQLGTVTYRSAKPPPPELPIYTRGDPYTPTGHERLRSKLPHQEGGKILGGYHWEGKKVATRQTNEWILGDKAQRVLSTAVVQAEIAGRGEDGDPFVVGNESQRYMTFPPEVAPKSYRSGTGRRGNAIFSV